MKPTCKQPNCTNKTKSMGRRKTGEQKFRRFCEKHRKTKPTHKTMRVVYTSYGLVDQKTVADSPFKKQLSSMAAEQMLIMHEESQKKFGSWTRRYRDAEIVYNYLLSMVGEIKGTAK